MCTAKRRRKEEKGYSAVVRSIETNDRGHDANQTVLQIDGFRLVSLFVEEAAWTREDREARDDPLLNYRRSVARNSTAGFDGFEASRTSII